MDYGSSELCYKGASGEYEEVVNELGGTSAIRMMSKVALDALIFSEELIRLWILEKKELQAE